MLTQFEKLAIRIIEVGFCYLPLPPIYWDNTSCPLKIRTRHRTLFLYGLSMFSIFLNTLAFTYVVGSHILFKRRSDPHWNTGILGIHIIFAVLTFEVEIWSALLLDDYRSIVAAWNQIFKLNERPLRDTTEDKLLTEVVAAFVAVCTVAPFFAVWISLYFDWDPFYFLFEDIAHKVNRSWIVSLLIWLSRTILCLAIFEQFRTGLLLTVVGTIPILNVYRYLKFLGIGIMQLDAQLKGYGKLAVSMKMVILTANKIIACWLSASFWVLIGLCWLLIKTARTIPLIAFITMLVVSITFFGVNFVVVSVIHNINERYQQGLTRCQMTARMNYVCEDIPRLKRNLNYMFRFAFMTFVRTQSLLSLMLNSVFASIQFGVGMTIFTLIFNPEAIPQVVSATKQIEEEFLVTWETLILSKKKRFTPEFVVVGVVCVAFPCVVFGLPLVVFIFPCQQLASGFFAAIFGVKTCSVFAWQLVSYTVELVILHSLFFCGGFQALILAIAVTVWNQILNVVRSLSKIKEG
ncbi:unnamed protein product [Orchesella dallaii]|uniref:Gustatory receptor n=1 Tax=Orchesella dallaii TaxID=48710 RepID=A0ABP1RVJ6_9HEXA